MNAYERKYAAVRAGVLRICVHTGSRTHARAGNACTYEETVPARHIRQYRVRDNKTADYRRTVKQPGRYPATATAVTRVSIPSRCNTLLCTHTFISTFLKQKLIFEINYSRFNVLFEIAKFIILISFNFSG